MRRLAAPTVLLACAASLLAAGPANAKLRLPAGADRAPELPPGVVVAELPPVNSAHGQRAGGPVLSTARAATRRAVIEDGERPFWATVNICDTAGSPNALGVRTSVPGNGSDERIWARYTAQWWSGAAQEWKTVGGSGATDWNYVGYGRHVGAPGGLDLPLRAAARGHHLRDARRGRARVARRCAGRHAARSRSRKAHRAQRVAVVRERTLLTETGMQGVQGGDPAGTSKAMCLIW